MKWKRKRKGRKEQKKKQNEKKTTVKKNPLFIIFVLSLLCFVNLFCDCFLYINFIVKENKEREKREKRK